MEFMCVILEGLSLECWREHKTIVVAFDGLFVDCIRPSRLYQISTKHLKLEVTSV